MKHSLKTHSLLFLGICLLAFPIRSFSVTLVPHSANYDSIKDAGDRETPLDTFSVLTGYEHISIDGTDTESDTLLSEGEWVIKLVGRVPFKANRWLNLSTYFMGQPVEEAQNHVSQNVTDLYLKNKSLSAKDIDSSQVTKAQTIGFDVAYLHGWKNDFEKDNNKALKYFYYFGVSYGGFLGINDSDKFQHQLNLTLAGIHVEGGSTDSIIFNSDVGIGYHDQFRDEWRVRWRNDFSIENAINSYDLHFNLEFNTSIKSNSRDEVRLAIYVKRDFKNFFGGLLGKTDEEQ